MTDRQKKNIFLIYFIFLMYLMFFGFNRVESNILKEYRYQILPTKIPVWIPTNLSWYALKSWIISLGNIVLFIPFGIFIPQLFKNKNNNYLKFISSFLIFIFIIELLQMLTYLGSFDTEDIIINTIGASIGYYSYKKRLTKKTQKEKYLTLILYIIVLTTATVIVGSIINRILSRWVQWINVTIEKIKKPMSQ